MDKQTFIIIYLSVSLFIVQFFWLKAEKKVSYFQGQSDLYQQMASAGEER